VLLFLALMLQFLVLTIRRIGEISKIGVGRELRWTKIIPTKISLYDPKGCVCKIDFTFTLALN
jgi:hypothetical protein